MQNICMPSIGIFTGCEGLDISTSGIEILGAIFIVLTIVTILYLISRRKK